MHVVIALVLYGIKRLVFQIPARPGRPHEVKEILFGDIQTSDPAHVACHLIKAFCSATHKPTAAKPSAVRQLDQPPPVTITSAFSCVLEEERARGRMLGEEYVLSSVAVCDQRRLSGSTVYSVLSLAVSVLMEPLQKAVIVSKSTDGLF